MFEQIPNIVLLAGTLLVFVFLADFAALKSMRQNHLKLAHEAKILLKSDNLNIKQKRVVADMLDDVFSWWYMPLAVILLPVALVTMISKRTPPQHYSELNKLDEFRTFRDLHTKSVISSNILFSFIFFIELLIVGAIAFICLGGYKAIQTVVDNAFFKASPNIVGSKHFENLDTELC